MIKLISKNVALKMIRRRLDDLGYMQMGAICQGSAYFSKKGFFHLKIRVSDHNYESKPKDDVVHAITISEPTICQDVEFRVRRANEEFLSAMRNQIRKKEAR